MTIYPILWAFLELPRASFVLTTVPRAPPLAETPSSVPVSAGGVPAVPLALNAFPSILASSYLSSSFNPLLKGHLLAFQPKDKLSQLLIPVLLDLITANISFVCGTNGTMSVFATNCKTHEQDSVLSPPGLLTPSTEPDTQNRLNKLFVE